MQRGFKMITSKLKKYDYIIIMLICALGFVFGFVSGIYCEKQRSNEITPSAETTTEIAAAAAVEAPTTEEATETAVLFPLTKEEFNTLACVIQGEAGGEDYKGKCLVAQCLLNACIENNARPAQMIKKYKYVGYNSNITPETIQAIQAVFYDGYKVTERPIKYFYAPAISGSAWHETQIFVIEHGAHRFFEERA